MLLYICFKLITQRSYSLSLSRFNVSLANFGTLLLILNFFLFITCTWTIRKGCNQAIKQLAFTPHPLLLTLAFWLLCLCFVFCGFLFTSWSWQFLVSAFEDCFVYLWHLNQMLMLYGVFVAAFNHHVLLEVLELLSYCPLSLSLILQNLYFFIVTQTSIFLYHYLRQC